MAKFKINVELKLNIEGEREDIGIIAENLRQQMGSVLDPAAQIANGQPPKQIEARPVESPQDGAVKKNKRKSAAKSSENESGDPVHTWLYDAAQWGFPLQTWRLSGMTP